jgi:Zn-dependent M28 family amino/carboxypeptidase
MRRRMLVFGVAAAVTGCARNDADVAEDVPVTPEAMAPALASITAQDILRRTSDLAADSMEGRLPGTTGEERAVRYLEQQMRAIGLVAGHPDGSYVQQVPLVGIKPQVSASLTIGSRRIPLRGGTDYIAESTRVAPEVKVEDSDLVFVGYGIVAPEYGWDDYKDVDVTGKTIVMLVNDPPIVAPGDSALDESVFRGRAMTYYGRWTYKYEIAAAKGAAAAIIIHETGPAGYPFDVLSGGFQLESFDIKPADNNMGRVGVQAWMPEVAARRFLSQMGQDFDRLHEAAVSKDFRPVELGARVSFDLKQELREVASRNVIGKLEGATRPDEYVVYTAHWDHLGKDESLAGDQIFNGAADNASGTAQMLEIAEAFAALPEKPARSILFLAVTAEEQGLLGAKYYAENPLYPLARTVANINMDGANQWGRTEDIVVIGRGNSTLDDVLAEAAAAQSRTLEPDPESEKGFFYRSDQFEFAKQGVPALYTDDGTRYVGKDPSYGRMKRDEYTGGDYHGVDDEVKPDWDMTGAADDAALLFEVGYRVSQRAAFPEWSAGNEFKARRDSMLTASTSAP